MQASVSDDRGVAGLPRHQSPLREASRLALELAIRTLRARRVGDLRAIGTRLGHRVRPRRDPRTRPLRSADPCTAPVDPRAVPLLALGADHDGTSRVAPPAPSAADLRALSRAWEVLDLPQGRTAQERAEALIDLAAHAVPVRALSLSEHTRARLGGLADAVTAGPWPDAAARDLHVAHLRRSALCAHGPRATGWPTLSVVLATSRPEWLDHAVAQFRRQRYPHATLCLVLHGPGFPSDEALAASLNDLDATVARVGRDVVFGTALNAGVAKVSGELVSKMDDDDWYDRDHLRDLVLARDLSGAEIVGKPAEFIYLAGSKRTVRRGIFAHEGLGRRQLAGGTLLLSTAVMRRVGGFAPLPRGVDQALIEAVLRAGHHTFMTHGFGYVLHRHTTNTWSEDERTFLRRRLGPARTGLDLRFAGVL